MECRAALHFPTFSVIPSAARDLFAICITNFYLYMLKRRRLPGQINPAQGAALERQSV